jgi:putative DNA primase/helicase
VIAAANDSPIFRLLAALGESVKSAGPGKWSARCPSHDDRHASLTITSGDDGKALLKCHAGCSAADIVARLGMTLRDLFPCHESANGNGHARKIVKTYDYIDAEGELKYQSVRYLPKGFFQRRPDGNGGWIWSMGDVERILYRLPALLVSAEDSPDDLVFIVEGEKDAERLAGVELIATTNVGGAGKWKGADGDRYAETLRGRRLAILPDNDSTGRNHAQDVARACQRKAKEVRVIELAGLPEKGDVSDWLDAGGTADELLREVECAPLWTPEGTGSAVEAKREPLPVPTSLRALSRDFPELRESMIDGILRRGQVGNIVSTSKAYKTFLILQLAVCFALKRMWLNRFPTAGGRVLIIDLELQPPDLVKRLADILAAMGAPADIIDQIDVVSFRGRNGSIDNIEPMLMRLQPRTYPLVILDPLYKTYPEKFDENSNAQMTGLYRRFERIAEHLDGAFVVIHHGTKGSQAEKRIVDVGAGASAQSRSADGHIALREHEETGCVVFDCRVRSFRPPEPLVLSFEYPLWKRELTLDPALLKTGKTSRNQDRPQPKPKEKPEPWTVDRFVSSFITTTHANQKLIVARARQSGISNREVADLLALALDQKQAFRWSFPKDKGVYLATTEQPVVLTVEGGRV